MPPETGHRWPKNLWVAALRFRGAILAILSVGLSPLGSVAQSTISFDTASVGIEPYSHMSMLLEKTIFKVNVLTLEVRLGGEDAHKIESLLRSRVSSLRADSVAAVSARSQDAFARIEFRRSISLKQLVRAVRRNMRKAQEAGYLSLEDYQTISKAFPGWFAFLKERQVHLGDQLLYRIHGDTLRTVYRDGDGQVLLDQTDAGAERRLAVLGSYFARGSDFRAKLLRSLPVDR